VVINTLLVKHKGFNQHRETRAKRRMVTHFPNGARAQIALGGNRRHPFKRHNVQQIQIMSPIGFWFDQNHKVPTDGQIFRMTYFVAVSVTRPDGKWLKRCR